jgi:hypothetical protein
MSFLNLKEIIQFSMIDTTTYRATASNTVWWPLYIRDFPKVRIIDKIEVAQKNEAGTLAKNA